MEADWRWREAEALPYYHGPAPKELASRLLKKEGDFLLRHSHTGTCFALAVFWEGGVCHVKLEREGGGGFRIRAGPRGPTLAALMDALIASKEPLSLRRVRLRRPVPRSIWEMRKSNVQLVDCVGRGAYGEVHKARLERMPEYPCFQRGVVPKTKPPYVAVKLYKPQKTSTSDTDALHQFTMEAVWCLKFCHRNVASALGVVFFDRPMMIVMEYMKNGSLQRYLRKNKLKSPPSQLAGFCVGACAGMAYLESRHCIHRDVASRNTLVADNERDVKICDFGLAQHRDKGRFGLRKPVPVPIRWLAPEVMTAPPQYSSKSDVWSFGVLLWETYSWAAHPYSDHSNSEVKQLVPRGRLRLGAPEAAPSAVAQAMDRAFRLLPADRPSFASLFTFLAPLAPRLCRSSAASTANTPSYQS